MITIVLALLSAEQDFKQVYEKLSVAQTSLTFTTHAAGSRGHFANAHLLVANEEALLVDTGATASDARRLVEAVKASGKQLKAVVLTMAEPDQTTGLDAVRDAFPGARVVSTRDVAALLEKKKVETAAHVDIASYRLPLAALLYAKGRPCAAVDVKPLKVLIGGCTFSGEHAIAGSDPKLSTAAASMLLTLGAETLLPNYGSGGPAAAILTAMQQKLAAPK